MRRKFVCKIRLQFLGLAAWTLGVLTATRVSADERWWYTTAGGSWHTASNWYLSAIPGTNDRANFYFGTNGTVTFSSNVTTAGLSVGATSNASSTVAFDLNGRTYTSNGSLWLGYYSSSGSHRNGYLTITDGVLNINGNVVTDFDSTVTVNNGGRLTASGTYQSATSGGSNSGTTKLYIGSNGIATFGTIDGDGSGGTHIEVTSGGVLNSGFARFASGYSFSSGSSSPPNRVLVAGSGSRWNSTGDIQLIGDAGPVNYAVLRVENNGEVNSTGQLYSSAQGRVELIRGLIKANSVNLAAGTLTHYGGTLRIDRSNPAAGQTSPGFFYNGSTTLQLGDAGIPIMEFLNGAYDWNLETVTVGTSSGQGRLYVYSGSDLTTTTGNIGQTANSGGTGIIELSGSGSTWVNSGTIFVGNGSTTAGTLNVFTDSQLTTNTLTSSALGTVDVYGGHLSANTWNIGRSVTQTGGTIDVGRLNGSVTITTSGTTKIGDSTNWDLTSVITGTGTTVKEGGGTVTLASGQINSSSLRIDAGNLYLSYINQIGDSTNVILNGGTLTLSGGIEKIGSLAGTSSVHLGSGMLEFGQNNSSTTFSGRFEGSGLWRKMGTGNLVLAGQSTNTGTIYIEAGTVTLSGGDDRISTSNGVRMQGGVLNLNNLNQQIGSLDGTSNIILGSGRLTTSFSGTFSYSGVLSGTGGLTKSGTGTLWLSGDQSYVGSTIVNGGTLNLTGSLASSFVQVTTGKLINNGLVSGTVEVGSGGFVEGTGAFAGLLNIQNGATLAPGNSIGVMNGTNVEFGSGGGFEFEITSATGSMGADWDGLLLSGTLDITATSGSPFELSVSSMSNRVNDFDSNLDYQWTFLTAVGGIQNFSADKFTINSTDFLNDLNGGSFSVTQNGNSLILGFSAVPEPSALMLVGSVCAGVLLRRRRCGATV